MLPFIHVIAASFATVEEVISKKFILIPTTFSLDAYRYIFSTDIVYRSLIVSILVTAVGTAVSMFLSSLMAYGLSRKELMGRRVLMFMVVFTMLFSGGMILDLSRGKGDGPDRYLCVADCSDSHQCVQPDYYAELLSELAGRHRGIGQNRRLRRLGHPVPIVIPLSMPAIATISLFYAVTYWNTYMPAILYLNDRKWPQVICGKSSSSPAASRGYERNGRHVSPPEQTIKMAVIVVATLPILLVYPFLQKHFAKGALLGSIKG